MLDEEGTSPGLRWPQPAQAPASASAVPVPSSQPPPTFSLFAETALKLRTQDRRGARRRGASVVEMAFVLPFLMFLFVVSMDYARVFYYGSILENCARNGAYYGSNYPNSSYLYNDIYGYKSMDEAVYKDASNLMSAKQPTTNPTYKVEYSSAADGTYSATPLAQGFVRVTVSWNFKTVTQYPFIPSTVGLSRGVIMRMAPVMPDF